jgi:hypothetical protein
VVDWILIAVFGSDIDFGMEMEMDIGMEMVMDIGMEMEMDIGMEMEMYQPTKIDSDVGMVVVWPEVVVAVGVDR